MEEGSQQLHNNTRVSQIMNVDTLSMLNTLKELEAKLSEHHKHDILFGSILPRLELLEKERKVSSTHSPTNGDTNTSHPTNDTPWDPSQEEHVMQKLQNQIDRVSEKYNLTLESKLSTLSLELDRVHKLLSVRPTTSELSKVMLSVQEINLNMMKTMNENTTHMHSVIKDSVGEEMAVLIENIKSNGDSNLRGVDGLVKQIETLANDVTKLRQSSNNEIKSINGTVASYHDSISELKKTLGSLKHEIDETLLPRSALESIEKEHAELSSNLHEIRGLIAESDVNQSQSLAASEAKIVDTISRVTQMELALESKVEEQNNTTRDVEHKLQINEEILGTHIEEVRREVGDVTEKFNKYDSLLQQMKAADIVKTISKHSTQLATHDQQIAEVGEFNTNIFQRFRQLDASFDNTTKEMHAVRDTVQGLEKTMELKMELALKDLELQMQSKLDGVVSLLNQQSLELSDAKDMVNSLSSTVVSLDQKLKATKKELTNATERLDDFQNSTSAALRHAETEQKKCYFAIEDLLPKLDYLSNKVRSAVELVDKHEDKMSMFTHRLEEDSKKRKTVFGGGGARQPSFRQTTHFSPTKPKFRVQPKTIEEIAEQQQASLDKVAPLKMKKVSMSNVDMEFPSPGQAQGYGVPESRVTLEPYVPVLPNDDIYFDELPDFEEDLEEIKEEIRSQAEYTAELCLSYEESSLKQSRVLELPRAICEHLTQTAQALAAFASNAADAETVARVLKASPSGLIYDDNTVNNLREEKLEIFIRDVVTALERISTREPGVIRLEARERYLKKLRTALVLCMSKHDQVIVAGNSRVGRMKIATCIACDRPLIDKVRRDQYIDLSSTQRPFTAAVIDKNESAKVERKKLGAVKISLDGRPKERDGGIQGQSMGTMRPSIGSGSIDSGDLYALKGGLKKRDTFTPMTDTQ